VYGYVNLRTFVNWRQYRYVNLRRGTLTGECRVTLTLGGGRELVSVGLRNFEEGPLTDE